LGENENVEQIFVNVQSMVKTGLFSINTSVICSCTVLIPTKEVVLELRIRSDTDTMLAQWSLTWAF